MGFVTISKLSSIRFFIVEEKNLKLQYQMISQKLTAVKIKKSMARQQVQIGEEVSRRGDSSHLLKQIELLQQTITMGEWETQQDKVFKCDQQQKLQTHKRKLEERDNGDLQARIAQLEHNMEEEIQRRLVVEKGKLEQEKLQFRQKFEMQTTQLQTMMAEVSRSAAELQTVKKGPQSKVKRQRVGSPQASTSRNTQEDDDVICYYPISDVEPD